MGGLPCAKVIIDNGNALTQKMQCLNATILLSAGGGFSPTYEEQESFMATAEAHAKCCAKIAHRLGAEAGINQPKT